MVEGKKLGLVEIVTAGVMAVTSLLTGNAKADNFNQKFKYGTTTKSATCSHIIGAVEGIDGYDVPFNSGSPTPTVDVWVRNSTGDYGKDARDPNSTTKFYTMISGRGISGTLSVTPSTSLFVNEDAFPWKNLTV